MAVYRTKKEKNFTRISNEALQDRNLSLRARGLLALMLSLPEDWKYSAEGLANICQEGVDAITTILRELKQKGYLVRESRIRREDGTYGPARFDIYETPRQTPPPTEPSKPKRKKPVPGRPRQAAPVQVQHGQSKEEIQKTKEQTKYPSIDLIRKEDEIDGYEELLEQVRENVGYEHLLELYGQERVDGAIGLIAEALTDSRPTVRIGKREIPSPRVRERFLSLNDLHLEYVFDCIDRSKPDIRNIRAYMLSALFNAPATMEEYYQARVNREVFGESPSERMAC